MGLTSWTSSKLKQQENLWFKRRFTLGGKEEVLLKFIKPQWIFNKYSLEVSHSLVTASNPSDLRQKISHLKASALGKLMWVAAVLLYWGKVMEASKGKRNMPWSREVITSWKMLSALTSQWLWHLFYLFLELNMWSRLREDLFFFFL